MSRATFQYKAIDRHGASIKGMLSAADQRDAYRKIVADGLKPVRIRVSAGPRRDARVTLKDLARFTYQFAVLLEAGIPVVDGLHSIAEQETNERLRGVVSQIARDIEGGRTITAALHPHRAMFGDVYVATVHAAETSGNLVEVMNSLAAMLEHEQEMRRGARGALIYPACVVVALVAATAFLMIVIVPRFAAMFEGRGVELPLPTQGLVWLSALVRLTWPLLLVGAGVGGFTLRWMWGNPGSRRRLDRWLHRLPYVRDILAGLAISRFAQVFGISLRSGLSLIDGLDLAGKASGRPVLQRQVERLRDRVRSGCRLTDALGDCDYLPPFTKRMLSAGEEAAGLSKMCQVISRQYDREVADLTKNIATVIEPILIVGLAFIVLIVALAVFLPLWNMGALV